MLASRLSPMCVQCVANSLPYVGIAVGGLKVMTWQARRRGPARDTAGPPRAAVEARVAPRA